MLTVYQYPKCSTCRKALAWLDQRGIEYRKVDIVLAPPARATLAKAARDANIEVKRMFNVSGQSYRDGNYKKKLTVMTDAQALDALARDGKLIRRPLAIGDGVVLVGFREDEWASALG